MMKNLSLLLLLSLSSFALADDAAIQRYIQAQVAVLEAQIDQLYDAIFVLDTENLSQEATFDRIGQPSFKAVDDALKNNGYSHSQFYQFANKYQTEIDDWLSRHTGQATQLNELTDQRDRLMQDYDQLIKRTASAN